MIYENNKEEKLKNQIIPQTSNDDFEEFWKSEVEKLRQKKLVVERKIKDFPYTNITTWEVKYNTHDDTIVKAYFSVPNDGKKKHACVIDYHGGGARKSVNVQYLACGVACFSIDVRSQGGETVDKANYSMGDMMGGIMTRGLIDKHEFYMKNIYLDAIRAVDVVASFEEVDTDKIITFGGSQGGALSVVAAALSGKVKKCYTVVTSYSCIDKRVEAGTGVFESTHAFLHANPQYTDAALNTLTYFDINNLISLIKVPTSFCIALADKICLPEYVYSVYTHANCEKDLSMVPFAPHGVPGSFFMKSCYDFAELAKECN